MIAVGVGDGDGDGVAVGTGTVAVGDAVAVGGGCVAVGGGSVGVVVGWMVDVDVGVLAGVAVAFFELPPLLQPAMMMAIDPNRAVVVRRFIMSSPSTRGRDSAVSR